MLVQQHLFILIIHYKIKFMPPLSTLFVKSLHFRGIHGSTGREPIDPQYFEVDIKIMLDTSKAAKTDALSDTYDYKNAREIARVVIEDEHHILIEKIGQRIVEQICESPKIFSAEVEIRKINASQNGVPGIVVSYKHAPQEMNIYHHE
jgi:7,8-dihydroneopterin aldolase/epimerase/oxygenase